MEVYFKDLISEEASLERLVDDLSRVVQGVDDLAKAIGVNLAEPSHSEVAHRLSHLKEKCQAMKLQVIEKARATDRMVRENPYPTLAIAFVVGLLAGLKIRRSLRA